MIEHVFQRTSIHIVKHNPILATGLDPLSKIDDLVNYLSIRVNSKRFVSGTLLFELINRILVETIEIFHAEVLLGNVLVFSVFKLYNPSLSTYSCA